MSSFRKVNYHNTDMESQINALKAIIRLNSSLNSLLEKLESNSILNSYVYYIGAGCITQSVWNYLCGMPLDNGIKDIDLVYFDADLSFKKENETIRKITESLGELPDKIDIKNQARVHLWYEKRFGYSIQPYNSVEEAINTWPTTATAVGVRKFEGELKIYSPFGLNDLFGMIVRANKVQITKEIYEKKVNRWIEVWPDLKVIPWD